MRIAFLLFYFERTEQNVTVHGWNFQLRVWQRGKDAITMCLIYRKKVDNIDWVMISLSGFDKI